MACVMPMQPVVEGVMNHLHKLNKRLGGVIL